MAVVQKKMSPEGDRQGLCGQMVVRSNKDYLWVPAWNHLPGEPSSVSDAADNRQLVEPQLFGSIDQTPSLFILNF